MTATTEKAPGRGALAVTRVLAGIVATFVFIQGALAGSHLNGTEGAIGIHGTLGSALLPLLTLATIGAAALATRRNRWVLPVALLGFLAMGAQIGMGYQDRLNVHVPLGIALFGLYLTIALMSREKSKRR